MTDNNRFRHSEDKLGGVVEAALNMAMDNEYLLAELADDTEIPQRTADEVYQALESYITDHLARIGNVLHGVVELHVWNVDAYAWDNGPDHEIQFVYSDSYDDYDQYVGEDDQGRHNELRLYVPQK
jgi:hypothetical protein